MSTTTLATRGRFLKYQAPSTFRLQITSMVDMFVILLVFLLKSFSTTELQPDLKIETALPSSNVVRAAAPTDRLILKLEEASATIGEKKVNLEAKTKRVSDPNFLPELYSALTKQKQGPLLIQADRKLNYQELQKVLYTCAVAGFTDVSLAVLAQI